MITWIQTQTRVYSKWAKISYYMTYYIQERRFFVVPFFDDHIATWVVPPSQYCFFVTIRISICWGSRIPTYTWKCATIVGKLDNIWVVVSNTFYLYPYLGKMNPFWLIFFGMGWFNHQLDIYIYIPSKIDPSQVCFYPNKNGFPGKLWWSRCCWSN